MRIARIDSWFLKYIKNIKEEPQFYASFGSFMHKLIELYYLGILNKDEMLSSFLSDFSTEVKGVRPPGSIVSGYIKSGSEYIRNFKPFECKTLGVEMEVRFNLNDNKFVGFIDYVGEKDGDIYIIDNKSRKLKPRSRRKKPTVNDNDLDSMLRQLYLYAAAVKQEYGAFPKWLCFNCFRNNVFIKELFDEDKYNETLEWANKTIEEIKNAKSFYPSVEFFKCRYLCGYNNICCYASQKST